MKYLLIFISMLAPFFGDININLSNIFNPQTLDYILFWDLRVPRFIVAFFSGATLALSGLIFQAIFRNPLTTPFTLGVSTGATLFFAIAITIPILTQFANILSLIGALSTTILIIFFSKRLKKSDTNSLLLIGIALSFFYSATLMIVYYLSNLQQTYSIMRFTMGSLSVVGFSSGFYISFFALALLFIIFKFKYEFKLILVSHEFAYLKGLNVKKINLILLFSVSITVGVCVSIVGPIGFVGLVIPHIIKLIYKKSSDKLLLEVFIYGGVFLVICDFISRNLGTTSEIPIGVVTSFIGAPFFIYIIKDRK